MFSDPFSITIDGVSSSLPRTKSEGLSSTYQRADGNLIEVISHQVSNNRIRSLLKVTQRIVAADVLTSVNDFQSASVQVVIDRPIDGFSVAQIQKLVAGTLGQLSDANIAKLYGQES